MKAPTPIAFDDALRRLQQVAEGHARARSLQSGATETIALTSAYGRVLHGAASARAPLPGFTNAAMDGFALRAADLALAADAGLEIAGAQFAGPATANGCAPGRCIRITTGAPLPAGADTVVPREVVNESGNRMRLTEPMAAGANVRRAGEDVAAGAQIAAPGQVLQAADIALLAAAGVASVEVARAPRIALLVSGDELRPPAAELVRGAIHDSNTPMLASLFAGSGTPVSTSATVPDEPTRIAELLGSMAASHDLVVACGGASVGERDYLPELADALGSVHFWRVRVRPGMPVLCASIADALLLVLPGNPVSAFCMFHAFVRPALDRLHGRTQPRERLHARLAQALDKQHDRHELRRGSVSCDAEGVLRVVLHPRQGSHQLSGVSASNALVHVPADCRSLAADAPVLVEPYGAILAP